MVEKRRRQRRHELESPGVVRSGSEQAQAVAVAQGASTERAMAGAGVKVGDRVELHNRFDDTWSSGFEVTGVVSGGYSVRRLHDDQLLPAPTCAADLRGAPTGGAWQ
jgi:hypothetical protein